MGAILGSSGVEHDAVLLASELATNAVRYGTGELYVRVDLADGDGIYVEIGDDSPDLPTLLAPSEAAHGRGLHIVAAVAADWGCEQRGAGKVVWFRLRPPS